MEKPTKQPDTGLAELHAKVVRLKKAVQAKKEERRKKQEEEAAIAKKAGEEKQLKDLFDDGARFAEWAGKEPRRSTGMRSDVYTIKIGRFKDDCNDIERYILFLGYSFKQLQDQFEERKKVINDPKREKKTVSVPPRCRVFPGSGTVINDCCGGVNGHERGCGAKNLQEFSLSADELKALRKKQDKELEELTEEIAPSVELIHAHMEGFIETILKSYPSPDAILFAVKVAMVVGADTFCRFGGRQKVLRQLNNTVIAKIEEKLSTDGKIDDEEIKEIERILNEVDEAVKQQVEK